MTLDGFLASLESLESQASHVVLFFFGVQGRSPLKEAVCWTLSLLVGDLVTAFEPQHLGADTGRQLRAATAALLAGRRAADHLWTDQVDPFARANNSCRVRVV